MPFLELPLELMAHCSMDADSPFFAKELRECIQLWLVLQPERRKEIFKLRYFDDYSTKEISEMLNISQKTVQKTLFKALESLKATLPKLLIMMPVLMTVNYK